MRFSTAFCVLVWLALGWAQPALAQNATEVRTRDGRVFFADQVQAHGDKVLIFPRGLEPVEIVISDLQCVASACGPSAPVPAVRPEKREAAPPPIPAGRVSIQGSNTIGATLMPTVLRRWAESLPTGSVDVKFGAKPEEQTIIVKSEGAEKAIIDLASHGSGTSFKGLLAGTATIGTSSRAIKPDEAQALEKKFGTSMLSANSEHILALDGLAVIVNRQNPLRDLGMSITTIARIFAGEFTDWSQLGGRPGPIAVHARDDNSGTFDTFNDVVMKSSKRALSASAKRYESSEALTDAVESDPNAVGFIGLPYIRNNHALSISYACGISHSPSRYAVQTGVYPLARRLYLYTAGLPADPLAREIIDFALSDAAQPAVREAGFIDQTVEFEDPQQKAGWMKLVSRADPRTPKTDLDSFQSEAKSMRRTSVNFRFASGNFELDGKAKKDVERVARLLKTAQMAGKPFYLVGFADNAGDYESNRGLSLKRAQAVSAALTKLGIKVGKGNVLARSWLAPVACNTDEGGRALNRRVELWIGEPPATKPAGTAATSRSSRTARTETPLLPQ